MKLYPNISWFFCTWIVSLLLIALFGFFSPLKVNNNTFFESLGGWDGAHYVGIAEFGYSEKFQLAFFPLYPLTIFLLTKITTNYLLSAILISGISSFFAMHFLYKLVKLDFDKIIAEKAIYYLLIFPTSFFLLIAYSEGLFLLLTILTFYYFRKGNILLSVIFCALATLTRPVGVALALALILQTIISGRFRQHWYIIFSFFGIFIYCIYLYQATSDPLYFLTAEKHWQRELSIPGLSFFESLRSLFTVGFLDKNFNLLKDFLFAFLGIGLSLRSFRFLPSVYALFSLISILIPLSTNTVISFPRFLLSTFPLFILLALIKNQKVTFLLNLLFPMILGLFIALFINGYWVS